MPRRVKPKLDLISLQKMDLTGLYLVDDRHDSVRTGRLLYRDGDYVLILLDPSDDMSSRMILRTMEQLTETHQEMHVHPIDCGTLNRRRPRIRKQPPLKRRRRPSR